MKIKNIILIISCIIISFLICKEVVAQYNYYDYNYNAISNPLYSINNIFNMNNYAFLSQPFNTIFSIQTLYQPYSSTSKFFNMQGNLFPGQQIRFANTFSNITMQYSPLMQINNLSNTFGMSNILRPTLIPFNTSYSNYFIDPLQPATFSPGNFFMVNGFTPGFLSLGGLPSMRTYQTQKPENNSVTSEDLLIEKIISLSDVFTEHILSLSDDLSSQIQQFQVLALETKPHFAETLEEFMQNAMGWASGGQTYVDTILPMAAEFAEKGMEMAYLFAQEGMELGFEFATMGEEVGPMANRILFMATQIGVMADRIGEMADRILFMSDNIVEFGDKIIYVSQLIVYTEELMVNVAVLINETIDTISDMLLTMMAITTDNDTYLQLRAELMADDDELALKLIYENMNLMLDHMLEYSLQLLENEAAQNQNELIIRELQLQLREITLSANECFCPGFCVDPNQCTSFNVDANQYSGFFNDPNGCFNFSLDPNQCISFCLGP